MTEQQRERDIAEMEAQMAHDTDQYFTARPQIMRTRDKETTFEAGFKAAWKARALSHAEGEAVPVDIDAEYEAFCRWCRESGFNLDYRLHTHSGRRVSDGAYIRDENARRMFRAWRERAAHPAPQVAVPEGWTVRPGRAPGTHGYMIESPTGEKGSVWLDDADPERKLLALMLAAAPTAPAGEPWVGSERRAELARQLHEYSQGKDRQPVSDPDGLPSDWRRVVEGAADMLGESAKQHRGRGDNATAAMCDRFGAMLRDEILSATAPDEREAVKRAADAPDQIALAAAFPLKHNPLAQAPDEREMAAKAIEQVTREYFNDESGPHSLHDYLLWRAKRLRAGKEGE